MTNLSVLEKERNTARRALYVDADGTLCGLDDFESAVIALTIARTCTALAKAKVK